MVKAMLDVSDMISIVHSNHICCLCVFDESSSPTEKDEEIEICSRHQSYY